MKILLSSDEVNLLVYRYLTENGYLHTSFSFHNEACITKNPFWSSQSEKLPPNALISFLQKALLYIHIEYHTDDDTGEEIRCDEPFSFFKRHECFCRNEKEGETEEEVIASTLVNKSQPSNINLSVSSPSDLKDESESTPTSVKRPNSVIRNNSKKKFKASRNGAPDNEEPTSKAVKKSLQTSGQFLSTNSFASLNETTVEITESEQEPPIPTIAEEINDKLTIWIGSPHDLHKKQLLTDYMILDEPPVLNHSLPYCIPNPSTKSLVLTRFESASPYIYQLPSSYRGINRVAACHALPGPLHEANRFNTAKTASWNIGGSILAIGYETGQIGIFNLSGKCLSVLETHLADLCQLAFSQDGNYLAAAATDGKLHIWHFSSFTDSQYTLHSSYSHEGNVTSISWQHTGVLASSDSTGGISVIETASQQKTTHQQQDGIVLLRWDPSGQNLAVVDTTQTVKVYLYPLDSSYRLELVLELIGHQGSIFAAEWCKLKSDDEARCLITASKDRQIILWNTESGTILHTLDCGHGLTALQVSPDMKLLAVGTEDNRLQIYRIPCFTLFNSFHFEKNNVKSLSWQHTSDSIICHLTHSLYNPLILQLQPPLLNDQLGV